VSLCPGFHGGAGDGAGGGNLTRIICLGSFVTRALKPA
jgi:hypothetical protein